ncbi:hypothetical protein BC332_13336 [Capsicum chinense]|nr:hypothetical protein BC332_13336 [Capsicum chinense]
MNVPFGSEAMKNSYKEEIVLFQTNLQQSHLSVPKPISWNQVSFLQSWMLQDIAPADKLRILQFLRSNSSPQELFLFLSKDLLANGSLMAMVATAYRTDHNYSDQLTTHILVGGFTGQLKGWWYKDAFLMRIYERPDGNLPYWKEKCLDRLPKPLKTLSKKTFKTNTPTRSSHMSKSLMDDAQDYCLCDAESPDKGLIMEKSYAMNSIALCRSAGVNVRMVTGDNINTATTIAREYGILTNAGKSIPKGYCIREAEEGVIDVFWVDFTVVTHRAGDHPYAVQKVAGGKSFMVKELEESFQLIGGGQFLDLTEVGCLGIIQICIRLYDGLLSALLIELTQSGYVEGLKIAGVHKFHPQSSIESLFDGLRIDDDRRHRKPTSFLVSPMDTLAEDRRAKVL